MMMMKMMMMMMGVTVRYMLQRIFNHKQSVTDFFSVLSNIVPTGLR